MVWIVGFHGRQPLWLNENKIRDQFIMYAFLGLQNSLNLFVGWIHNGAGNISQRSSIILQLLQIASCTLINILFHFILYMHHLNEIWWLWRPTKYKKLLCLWKQLEMTCFRIRCVIMLEVGLINKGRLWPYGDALGHQWYLIKLWHINNVQALYAQTFDPR